jgi:hypothetical protein
MLGQKDSIMAKSKAASLYSVHPGVQMVRKWVEDMPAKTGKSFEQWLAHIKKKGPKTESERRDWLKKEHGFGTNTAAWLAACTGDKTRWEEGNPEAYLNTAEGYVQAMLANKPDLKPIYDALLKEGLALGKDVKACPCQTIVPLYRNNVFAQLKPSTRTRLDLGFCLRGKPFTARLLDTGGTAKKDRITHKVGISSVSEIDDEVRGWLREAYERGG